MRGISAHYKNRKIFGFILAVTVFTAFLIPVIYPAFVKIVSEYKVHRKTDAELFRDAENYFVSERYDDAKVLYEEILEINSYGKYIVKSLMRLGEIAENNKNENPAVKYRKAIRIYKIVLQRSPSGRDAGIALAKIAVCYKNLTHYSRAIQYYQMAAEKYDDPSFTGKMNIMVGECYVKLGAYDVARELFASVVQETQDPEVKADALYSLAGSFYTEAGLMEVDA